MALLRFLLFGGLILLPLSAQAGFELGRIYLKSGEQFEGEVLKTQAEHLIVLTSRGLRVVPRAAVDRVEAGVAVSDRPASPAAIARGASPPGQAAAPLAGPRAAAATPAAAPRRASPSLPDPRLDSARAGGGPPPRIEIVLTGSIGGTPLPPADVFTLSRLTHFFTEVSRPRFVVLNTSLAGAEAEKKAPPRSVLSGPAEYRAEITGTTAMHDITFFETPVLKTYRSEVTLRLVRLSDKKVVESHEVSEDESGDAQSRDEVCRRVYNRNIEKLIREIGLLRAFRGQEANDVKASRSTARP